MIRKMTLSDIDSCAEILCHVYNNEMWQCRWSFETAKAYLNDYFEANKFIGFTLFYLWAKSLSKDYEHCIKCCLCPI